MSLELLGILGIVLMLVLMFLRMPIGPVMALVGFLGYSLVVGFEQGSYQFAKTAFSTAATYMLSVIPLFVLMGILASHAKLSDDAFYVVNKWIGHLPGGLAMATIGGCTAFAAVCGAATATAVTMVKVALPEMRKFNYADQLSLGTIASGGMLGFMIPPSIPFILYAYLTEESIGSLFMAGILPGLLIAVLFLLAVYITCRRNPNLASRGPKSTWKERVVSMYRVWGVLVLFLLVMGGIYGGFFTPTEAGAVGAFGALILGLAKRRINGRNLLASLSDTASLAGMILILIIGSTVFNNFIVITEIPFTLAEIAGSLPVPPVAIMAALLIMYVIVGFFMDIIAVIIITVPIIYPILQTLHIDPVWFGVLTVLTIMIGSITPPVGIVVYAVGGIVKEVPLFTIFRGVWPYLFAMLAAMVILVAFPQISLWLPSVMIP